MFLYLYQQHLEERTRAPFQILQLKVLLKFICHRCWKFETSYFFFWNLMYFENISEKQMILNKIKPELQKLIAYGTMHLFYSNPTHRITEAKYLINYYGSLQVEWGKEIQSIRVIVIHAELRFSLIYTQTKMMIFFKLPSFSGVIMMCYQ